MMKKRTIVLWSTSLACLLLFLLLILLLRTVNVAPAGPAGVPVGLSALNGAVARACGAHETWDTVTSLVMYASFLILAAFGALGLWQLVRRRSLRAVDAELYVYLSMYVVMVGIYLLFLFFTVNTVPYPLAGEVKASFPSSHVLATATVLGTGALWVWRHTEKRVWRLLAAGGAAALSLLMVVGRLFAGAHWLTDVLAALLASAALVLAAAALVSSFKIQNQ